MTFENALTTMKKYGGRIRRSKYPNYEFVIINDIFFTLIYDESKHPTLETEISISTVDIMADDWEVNLVGNFI